LLLRRAQRQNGLNGKTPMLTSWNVLSDDLQLALAQQALLTATETIAAHAETLAQTIEMGELTDRGGADALRLLASVVRATRPPSYCEGHA